MEMRNTEQLLASIGRLAHKVDSLAEANAALKHYGPESFLGDCISVKKKSDQQSAITKQNIHVSSMSGKTFPKTMFSKDIFHRSSVKSFFFNLLSCCCVSGPTEQEILQHLEEIVELALPLNKFKKRYEDGNTAKNLILNRVTFYQACVDDF